MAKRKQDETTPDEPREVDAAPVDEGGGESATETSDQSASEPAAESAAEPAAEPAEEPRVEPAEEPGPEAPDEPVVEGAEEPAADEATGQAAAGRGDAGAPAHEPAPTPLELAADARYSATGKRKSSIARVILRPGTGNFELNGRSLDTYFPRKTLQEVVRQPLKLTGYLERVDVQAKIHGGGVSSQAGAVRHGIAKALIEADPNLRAELKRRQLLTRDPRVKERRKAGLKKARKRPQFSKR
jgi:small subunit ribosomal protein S9